MPLPYLGKVTYGDVPLQQKLQECADIVYGKGVYKVVRIPKEEKPIVPDEEGE